MVERRGGARFALEPLDGLGIGDRSREELQRDATAETRVVGRIHHAHAAAAESLDDAVMGDGPADHGADILLEGIVASRLILTALSRRRVHIAALERPC